MSNKENEIANVLVRLPRETDDWLRKQARRSLASRGGWILRLVQEKMAADAEQSKKAAG